MDEESLMPERDAIWAKQDGLTPKLAAEMLAFGGKMEMERNAWKARAMSLPTLDALVSKWDAEGTRCGEEGRNSDDAWDDDGDEWRERRAVYFECAEELKAALREIILHNATAHPRATDRANEK